MKQLEIIAGELYDVYCAAVGGKAFNGDLLPSWDTFRADPSKRVQSDAWIKVAETAVLATQIPDIASKTVGMLIDELVTTDIKCFMAQEVIMKPVSEVTISDRANAATSAQELNRRRNELIRAIDVLGGKGLISHTGKTY